MSDWLIPALEDILRRVRSEQRRARAAERYADTRAKALEHLLSHPDASANAVWREIGGRRQDVLRAVRDARSRFPERGNHQIGAEL